MILFTFVSDPLSLPSHIHPNFNSLSLFAINLLLLVKLYHFKVRISPKRKKLQWGKNEIRCNSTSPLKLRFCSTLLRLLLTPLSTLYTCATLVSLLLSPAPSFVYFCLFPSYFVSFSNPCDIYIYFSSNSVNFSNTSYLLLLLLRIVHLPYRSFSSYPFLYPSPLRTPSPSSPPLLSSHLPYSPVSKWPIRRRFSDSSEVAAHGEGRKK